MSSNHTLLTPDQLEKVIDLFQDQLTDDELRLPFVDLHHIFDPNQLINDLVEDEIGREADTPEAWAERIAIFNQVSAVLDAEATLMASQPQR